MTKFHHPMGRLSLQDLFSIPELLNKVGLHLTPPDLFSCIQVNKRWNTHQMPLLWQTIDDTMYSWPRVLEHNKGEDIYKADESMTELGSNNMSLIQILCKNGHLVRHLRIHHPFMIDLVYSSGTITHLFSLEIFDLLPVTAIRRQPKSNHHIFEEFYIDPAATVATPDARTFDEILLSPLFNGVFAPRLLTATFDSQSTQDRLTVQRFWLLVIQNSKTLCKLRLHRSLNVLARIGSVKFLRNTILSLQQLCDFDNHSDKLNVAEFLDHLPHLQNLMTPTFQLQNNMLHYIKSLPIQLQSITLTGQILARGFFTILAQLPSLRFLRVIGLTWDNITDREIHNVMEGIPSNLPSLEYMFSGHNDSSTNKRILRWLPHLRQFRAFHISTETVSSLVRFCPLLEEYREWSNGLSIHRKFNQPSVNILKALLRDCIHLRVIDGIRHRLEISELLKYSWVSRNLVVFRVQIVGVTRLSIEQQDRFKRAAEKVANLETLTTQEVGLLQLVGQSRYEQEQILERLASLRCLQVLDLGFEYRRVDLSNELQPRTDLFEGKKYISYGMPIFDTLELSLDAGLSHLARLQRLEVFGFEGLNHRIGEEELQWIAEAWPRLRVLRGLHPITLKYLRPDRRRDELREYMQELRQDVEQKGAEEQC